MKVWPIDPLVPRNLRLEVPEKLPQGCALKVQLSLLEPFDEGFSRDSLGNASGSGNASRQSRGDLQ